MLVQILWMFPDDETAEAWFIMNRWPNGVHCPHCDSDNILSSALHPTKPFRCRKCCKRLSVKTGTVMQSSNLGYQIWALAGYLMSTNLKGVSFMKIHRNLGVSYRTAWHLTHRFRETWQCDSAPFSGSAEVVDACIDGKRKALTGRDATGKKAIAGVEGRETNQVTTRAVAATDAPTLQGFIRETAKTGASVFTDDAAAYRGISGFRHEAVNYMAGEHVRDTVHTNGIESFWAVLKRGYQGTFHDFSEKHLDQHVSKFAGRHNVRPVDTADQKEYMAQGMLGKHLCYRDLLA